MADVAEQIRDDLIAQDVRYQRVNAGVRREVDRVLRRLARELKGKMVAIDPHSAKRADARQRRLKRLERESREVIAEHYREVEKLLNDSLRRIVKVESRSIVNTFRKNLP